MATPKKPIEVEVERSDKAIDVEHADGWANLVTQVGTSKDKRVHNKVFWEQRSQEEYEQLYAGDEIASRIINVIPEEALRRWVEWKVDKDKAVAIEQRAQSLDMRGAIERTWKWARTYGGGCIYIVTDTNDSTSPLKQGEKVLGLRDLSRYDLRILSTDVESDFGHPNFGHPRVYYLVVQMGSQFKGYPIHWTRMVRFDGYMVPRRTFIRNNYWHDSILNRLFNVIRNYQSSNDSAASILQDFNIGIYKMKGLANLMQSGKESVVKSRLEMINMSRSVIRAVLMDSDNEEYEDLSRSVDGLAEMLQHQANRLVAATDIPHTKLLGESPDGSNATGNSTTQQWYNHIQSEQENYLRPRMRRLVNAVFPDYPDLDWKFHSLHQATEEETAELRNKVAQTDQIYFNIGALDPSEITESRFGGDEYSMETKLDTEGRASGLIAPHAGSMEEAMATDPNQNNGSGDSPEEEEKKPEEQDAPKKDSDLPLFDQTGNLPGTQFGLRNETTTAPRKVEPFISQTMSEPMRDPRTDPKIKPGGTPSHPRVTAPEVGNGIVVSQGRTDSAETPRKGPRTDRSSVVAVMAGNLLLMGKTNAEGLWTLPGGHADTTETAVETAVRELMEETGITVTAKDLDLMGSRVTPDGHQVSFFSLRIAGPVSLMPDADPDQEVREWKWIDISAGLPMGIKDALKHSPNYALQALSLE